MVEKANTTKEDVKVSVSSIYSELLEKRRLEKEAKEEKKRLEKEEKQKRKEEEKGNNDCDDKVIKMSKKERQEASFENWKEIVIGLTGDDIEYSEDKKKKKKYNKWIGEEDTITTDKPKKAKKKNYKKEFEAELNMLKNLVTDQNKFTNDLQKRFNSMIGPNTKDAMPLNKTQVDLASVINNSRSNALGVLNAIGNVKKTVADLYLRQQKQDADLGKGGSSDGEQDLGILGSKIASSYIGNSIPVSNDNYSYNEPQQQNTPGNTASNNIYNIQPQQNQNPSSYDFDPSTWDGPSLSPNDSVLYESIPHKIVVEFNKNDGSSRFKAVRNDTGEELVGCPVPTSDISRLKINEKDMVVKGEFDETYKLEII